MKKQENFIEVRLVPRTDISLYMVILLLIIYSKKFKTWLWIAFWQAKPVEKTLLCVRVRCNLEIKKKVNATSKMQSLISCYRDRDAHF